MRADKELFVSSNLLGGSPWEVLSIFVGTAAIAHWANRLGRGWISNALALVIPLCLFCTVGADVAAWVAWMAVVGALLTSGQEERFSDVGAAYRGIMMLFTCICILAVDFRIFPRRFGKTEEFGFSLMDSGVGLFVFSSGMFAKGNRASASLQVVALGVVRLFVTWFFDYHQHVTEYGSHWNFFLTLGVVQIVCLRVLQAHRWSSLRVGLLAISIALLYQFALSSWGVTEFLLRAPRTTLFTHNREGIASSAGFVSIFLFALSLRPWLHSSDALMLICALFGICAAATHFLWQELSRRMANLGYICFIVSANALVLWILQLIGVRGGPALGAISRAQLAVFLAANIATGIVNLSMNTMTASETVALAVLITYATSLSFLGVFLTKSFY